MKFEASLDTLAKIASIVIVALTIGLGVLTFKDWLTGTNPANIDKGFLIPFSILSVITFLCFLFAPISYTLTDRQLIINRPLFSRKIDLTTLLKFKKVTEDEMAGTIRTFGVGGLFGYFGKFANDLYGEMNYYVTQRKNYVVLITDDKEVIVLSPNDQTLVDRIEEKMKEITNPNKS